MRPKARVNCEWSPSFAYVIGIFASDGNLSPDGRHLNITSKDEDLLRAVREVLHLDNKIGMKARGSGKEKRYFVLQFGDVHFYKFLLSIGLTPAKSKTIGKLHIPQEYFYDFLRGCIDGDGSIGVYKHPESNHPQIRLRLCSASLDFVIWILRTIQETASVSGGYIYTQKYKGVTTLSFGKRDALEIMKRMYYAECIPALERKRRVAIRLLGE